MGNPFAQRRPFAFAGLLVLLVALAFPAGAAAHVTTDQADYAPGSVVTISGDNSDGAGYLPGEIVNVVVTGPNGYAASCSATVDDGGNWSCQTTLWNSDLALGSYGYTATGSESGVVEVGTFTDGNVNVRADGTNGQPVSIDWTRRSGSNCTGGQMGSGTIVATTSGNGTGIAGGAGTNQSLSLLAHAPSGYQFVSWTNASFVSSTANPGCLIGGTMAQNVHALFAPIPVTSPTTLEASVATGTYGGTVNLSATLTVTAGGPVVGETVSFTLNGASAGTATTNGSGIASISGVSLANIGAGTYPTGVGASFAGTSRYLASTGANRLTVDAAGSLVTIDCSAGAPYAYSGEAQTPCTAKASGARMADLNLTSSIVYADNTSAGTAHAAVTWAGDANHLGGTAATTFEIGPATSSVTIDCSAGAPYTYSGGAQTPCTAKASGAGMTDVDLTNSIVYADNTSAGNAHATVAWAGDGNHTGNSAATTFEIGKATSTVTVVCDGGPFVYDAHEQTPCSATVTGAGSLNQSLEITYENNINAGTATARASFAGDDNHEASNGSTTFEIGKASSAVTVTCQAGPFAYTGGPQRHCSAAASGIGMADVENLRVTYENNVDAGTATASATWDGDANHEGSTGSATFTIRPAHSSVIMTCPELAQAYTGFSIEPCGASVMTEDGIFGDLKVTYSNNVDAGTAGARADYAGDKNHDASSNTGSFTIRPAHSSVVVTCPTIAVVYTGSELEPCTAGFTTEDGLSGSLTPSYSNNVNAGTAAAAADYAGDANHDPSNGSAAFEIAKADSTVTLTCPTSVVYNALAQTPCSATATGAGSLNEPVAVDYTDNTNAGTTHASASYAGDANHNGSTASTTFTIEKATLTATFTVANKPYDGTKDATILTESATGQKGTDTCTLTGGTASFDTEKVGADKTVTLSGWKLDGTNCANYQIQAPITTKASITAWSAAGHGFYSPVALGNSVFTPAPDPVPTALPAGYIWNTVKGGSTVPLKFNVFAGTTEKTALTDIRAFNQSKMSGCTASDLSDPVDYVLETTGGTQLRYDTTARQWIDNWKTNKVSATECWRVWVTFADGSTLESFFKLNK